MRLSAKEVNAYNPLTINLPDQLWIFWEEQNDRGSSLVASRRSAGGVISKKTIWKNSRPYFLQFSVTESGSNSLHAALINPDKGIEILSGRQNNNQWESISFLPFKLNEVFNPRLYYNSFENKLYLFYLINQNGTVTIRYQTSLDAGRSWQVSPVSITTEKDQRELNQLYFPAVVFREKLMYVFYQRRNPNSQQSGDDEIFMTIIDAEQRTDMQVTQDESFDYNPQILASGDVFYLMWNRFKDGNWEVVSQRMTPSGLSADFDRFNVINSRTWNALNPRFYLQKNILNFSWTSFSEGSYQVKGRALDLDLNLLQDEFFYVKSTGNTVHANLIFREEAPFIVFLELDKSGKTSINFNVPDRSAPAVEVNADFPKVLVDAENLIVRWKTPADSSGIRGYAWTLDNSPLSAPLTMNELSNVLSADLSSLAKLGSNFFHILAVDNADNLGPVNKVSFILTGGRGEFSKDYPRYLAMYRQKQYTRITEELRPPPSIDLQYLKGLSYLQLAQITKAEEAGKNYRYSIANLKEAAEKSFSPELKSKCRLWKGVAEHFAEGSAEAAGRSLFDLFLVAQSRELKRTPSYNDALFYIGIVYSDMGEEERGRKYFKLMKSADNYDRQIFDIRSGKFLSLNEAYIFGMDLLTKKYSYLPAPAP